MSSFKRLACFMLVLAMCVVAFAACTIEDENQGGGGILGVNFDEDETIFPYPDYKKETTLKILCVNTERHGYGTVQFDPNEETKYTVVSEAVKVRNQKIYENHGIAIETQSVKYPVEEYRILMQGNDKSIHLICDSADRMLTAVLEDMFWSFDDKLDYNKVWWDVEAIDSIAIDNKHFFVCGDALITDDDNTYLYIYNKDMYRDYGLAEKYGDIYEIVKNGEFTIDLMEQMSRMVSHADENGQWGKDATYGHLSHAYGATIMMNGFGMATASIDPATGFFQLNVGNTSNINAFDKVYSLMSDKHLTQRAELIASPGTGGFGDLEKMFVSGKGLFYNTTTASISILKGLDIQFEFGVLPVPKLDNAQEKYYSAVNRYQSSVLGIPVNNSDEDTLEATVVLLQALGYYSSDVKRAYYDQTLKLQGLKDQNDEDMIELIFKNRFYDLGSMFGWGNNALINFYGSVIATEGNNTIVDKWETIQASVEADMIATVEKFQKTIN